MLKPKFQELACKKMPTGDPNCPLYIKKPSIFFTRLYKLLMGPQVVLRIIVVTSLTIGMTTRMMMRRRTISIISPPNPQPSFHVWTASPAALITPSLLAMSRCRTRPLKVVLVLLLLTTSRGVSPVLEVGVIWEVGHGRRGRGGALLSRRMSREVGRKWVVR